MNDFFWSYKERDM